MTELDLLRGLLLFGLAIAPIGTYRFLGAPTPMLVASHLVALVSATLGFVLSVPQLSVVWLLFCVGGFLQFLRHRAGQLKSPAEVAKGVPLLFSLVAATWIVGGANDLHILGYGPAFSYYAALHGTFLGWIMVGALAILANTPGPQRRVHVVSVFVCFVSFMLVAVGINRVSVLKPIGVFGITAAVAVSQLTFLSQVWRSHKTAFAIGTISFLGFAFTIGLAWMNELSMLGTWSLSGLRAMVSIHGVLNGLVVAPFFLLAVILHVRQDSPR